MNYHFENQYDLADISALAARYLATPYKNWTAAEEDQRMEDAGWRLVNGAFDIVDATSVVRWKSHRPVWLFVQNDPSDVEEAIKEAIAATRGRNLRRAVKALMKLKGVGLKMASAILTAMFPTCYTVCDIRASEALGQDDYSSLRYYVAYLTACRRIAAQYPVTLRDFDRANWQWSKEQAQKARITKNRKRRCSKPCAETTTMQAAA